MTNDSPDRISVNWPCDACDIITTGGYFLSTYKTERGTTPYVCKPCHDDHYAARDGADPSG